MNKVNYSVDVTPYKITSNDDGKVMLRLSLDEMQDLYLLLKEMVIHGDMENDECEPGHSA